MSILRKCFMLFAIGAVLGLMPAEYSPVKREGVPLTSQLKQVVFTAGTLNDESFTDRANDFLQSAADWVFGTAD